MECLRRATSVTDEWIYSPTSDGNIRSRLTQRLVKHRTVPVVLKDLYEIIDAQPSALTVIKKLLDWIGRVDLASQRGAPRPAFKTLDGEPIFPQEEEKWWLTDFQQRKKPDDTAGDEDGPVSEAEEQEKEDTEDEDPTSEEDVEQYVDDAGGLPAGAPSWTYFEKQGADARCGMHALNNAVGRAWQTPEDMDYACDEYLRASQQEGSAERRDDHVASSGWYSSEVMACAVTSTSMRRVGHVEYVMTLEPLHVNPERLHSAVGAVVNVAGHHWVALRSVKGQVLRLDSKASTHQPLSGGEYKAFVNKHPSFVIELAECMSG